MPESKITPELIAAYVAAEYRVEESEPPFTMRVARRCDELLQLMARLEQGSALFMTGFNPHGEPQSDAVNAVANALLRDDLRTLTDHVFGGIGVDPQGRWPAEESFLALGLEFEFARALAVKFGQNAILWAEGDAIPRLILLR